MKATEVLRQEHENIKLMMRVLEIAFSRMESGMQIPKEDLERMIEFLKIFVERCHFEKEEKLLSPSLEAVDIAKETGPIGIMFTEHALSREYIDSLNRAVGKYKKGDQKSVPKIIETTNGYIKLMTQHINKENNTLFPLADARLSKEDQERLVNEFDALEQKVMNQDKEEEFFVSLARLRDIYLSRR